MSLISKRIHKMCAGTIINALYREIKRCSLKSTNIFKDITTKKVNFRCIEPLSVV